MKFVTRALLSAGFLGAFAGAALAQQDDKEATKKKILERVERRLKQEDERLLKELEKLVDEALKGTPAPAPAPARPKAKLPAKKSPGYLGVRADEVTAEDRKKLGIKGGLKLAEAIKGGPADKAGLRAGDIITSIDGRTIDTPFEVPAIIQAAGAGTTVKVGYYRDGKKQTTQVTLGRHPSAAPEGKPSAKAEPKKKGDLRERVKKFMDKEQAKKPKQEPRKPQDKKPAEPGKGPFALDEELLDQLEGMFEQFGVDREQLQELLEQLFPGGEGDGGLPEAFKELLKGFNMEKFFGDEPKAEPAPAPRPKREFKPTGKAWLGVQPEELSEALAAQLDLEEGVGLLLVDILPGSPAEKAGLKKNDILIAVGGKKMRGEGSLSEFMSSAKIGQEVAVTVLRKGRKQDLKVKLAERMK